MNIDRDTLHEALALLRAIEDHTGPQSIAKTTDKLIELYEAVMADGGRASPALFQRIMDEARGP